MVNAQQMICKAFGYSGPLLPTDEIFKIGKKNVGKIVLTNDNVLPCAMCGKVHPVGYHSTEGASHLIKAMIPNSFNECYALQVHNFICEHCGYSIVSYGSPSKMKHGKKIINVLINTKGYKEMYFNSDDKNELYGLLKKPPKPPFVILINSRGTVLENLVFSAKPTISKGWIVVNYGLRNLEVSPSTIFECINDARVIAQKIGSIEPTSDNIFNRQDDVRIKPNKKTINSELFTPLMSEFLAKYNRNHRLVAKMVINAYLKENKAPVQLPEEIKNTGLFDF